MPNHKKTQNGAEVTLEDVLGKLDAIQKTIAADRRSGAADRKLLVAAVMELKTVVDKDFKRVFETMDRFNKNLTALNELVREHAKDLTDHAKKIAAVEETVADHDERLRLLEEERAKNV